MRLAIALSGVLLLLATAACRGGSRVFTSGSVRCAPEPTPTRDVSVRRPTPVPSASDEVYADFRQALSQYYDSRYRATYDICAIGENEASTVTGSLSWFKDAASLRVNAHIRMGDKRISHTDIAVGNATEPRLAECSENLGAYYSTLLTGEQLEGLAQMYPEIRDYEALGATCINAELDASNEDTLTHPSLSLYGLLPVELKNLNASPGIWAPNLSEERTTAAGRDVTCFTYGDYGVKHRNCFDAKGLLVASGGGAAAMQITESDGQVSSADFDPPYPVVASPEQCPGNTPWDRATPVSGAETPVAPAPGQYHDTLTKFFNVRSKVTYHLCYHGGDGDPPAYNGQMTWVKDGTTRARFDITERDEGATSYFASRTDQTVCSADVPKYLRDHAGGDQLKSPGLQALMQLKAVCFPDSKSLDGHDSYEYDEFVLGRIFPVPNALTINMAGWPHTDLPFDGKVYHRTVSGVSATCFVAVYDREECYGDDGVLLFARDGVSRSLEATSVSTNVTDVDFQLPYELNNAGP